MAARWILDAIQSRGTLMKSSATSTTSWRIASILRGRIEDRPRHAHENFGDGRGRASSVLVQAIECGERGEHGDHVLGLLQRAAGAKAVVGRESGGQLARLLLNVRRARQPSVKGRIGCPVG